VYTKPLRENIRDIMASTSFFEVWLDEAQKAALMRLFSMEELLKVLKSFQKGKSPGPDK
jgi:hypothetical protein